MKTPDEIFQQLTDGKYKTLQELELCTLRILGDILCDGRFLLTEGITDEDTQSVETLYSDAQRQIIVLNRR